MGDGTDLGGAALMSEPKDSNQLRYALSSEVRCKMLKFLGTHPGQAMTATDLAERLELDLPRAAYHVERLFENGAVALQDTASDDPTRRRFALSIDEPWALRRLDLGPPETNPDEAHGP